MLILPSDELPILLLVEVPIPPLVLKRKLKNMNSRVQNQEMRKKRILAAIAEMNFKSMLE